MDFMEKPEAKAESEASHFTKRDVTMKKEPPDDSSTLSRAASPAHSDGSMGEPPFFSAEPGPSDTQSKSSSCLSMKSDMSKMEPLHFTIEPVPPDPLHSGGKHWVCNQCQASHRNTTEVSPCPKCGNSPVANPEIQTKTVEDDHKMNLRARYESVIEGTDGAACQTPINRIFTELYITEGLSQVVDAQHEVSYLEKSTDNMVCDCSIKCQDIFKVFAEDKKPIRVALTNGVAGVGKTFSIQKFTLDWAEGSENQEVDLVVPLSFRELNLVREESYSLLKLIQVFHPSLQKLTRETLVNAKLLFIFDGLDESRLSLEFESCEPVSDPTQSSKVSVLLENLIKGNLLPSALVWITSRPAAASQIPASCVDRVTEVRGFFTDAQKVEYFRKRFENEELSNKIISHIKTSQTLLTMCQIPVFCWITATVLNHMLKTHEQMGDLPKTLTDLYAHFLVIQTHWKKLKYDHKEEFDETDRVLLLKLGRLAFEQLEKGNIMFYEEDLKQVGLDVKETLVYTGVCTEIFKTEKAIFNKTIYCFVHLSVQEFVAAVYMLHTYISSEAVKWFMGDGNQKATLDKLLKKALKNFLKSKTGRFDLVVRFLHGLSLESNLKLLKDLLGPIQIHKEVRQNVIKNLRKMNIVEAPSEKHINIIHCLLEMKDHSILYKIQEILKSKRKELTDIECSTLVYALQISGEVLDEFDICSYNISLGGRKRLIPAVRNCRNAKVERACRTEYEFIASALKSNSSHLQKLQIGGLDDLGMETLCAGFESRNCRLESLKLSWESLPKSSCSLLVSALKANPSHLKELNLNACYMVDSEIELLCGFLQSPDCRLERLGLTDCLLTETRCSSMTSALKANPSHLKELDLSRNHTLKDSGVELLCDFLQSPDCRLETLRLRGCCLSKRSCSSLVSALKNNPSHLKELNLSGNRDLKDPGVELLCGFLQSPDCRLESLRLADCILTKTSCFSLASALKANPSHLTVLSLSYNGYLLDSGVKLLCGFLESPGCRLEKLELKSCNLASASCLSLASALKSNPSHLKELNLSENRDIKDSGVELLCAFLESSDCHLESLRLTDCSLTETSCGSLALALTDNPSHLKELDLSRNILMDSGVKMFSGFIQSPYYQLERLGLNECHQSGFLSGHSSRI